MKILALEFSSSQRSVAVARADANKPFVATEIVETGSGATHALSMVDEALREARLEREEIESLAVGLGPGSYTGVRVAIALAQGWQLGHGVKLVGISSAECLAAQAQAENISGTIGVVVDAQQNEFYFESYEISENGRRKISPLRILTPADVELSAASGTIFVGPEVTRWFANGKVFFPRAAALAKLAVARNDFIVGEKLEPIYLREARFVKAPKPRVLPDN